MINRFILMTPILLCSFILSASCKTSEPLPEELTEEPSVEPSLSVYPEDIYNCLEKLHTNAALEIDLAIDGLDEKIASAEEQQALLTEMIADIDNAILSLSESVAEEKLETGAYWYFTLPKEEYSLFENEYYEITEFELKWYARVKEGKWELTTKNIMIRDRETGVNGPPDILHGELLLRYSNLDSNRVALVQAKEDCAEILADVLSTKDAWELAETSSLVFIVRGYGLGYEDQLVLGEWTYYSDSDSIEPKSVSARKLKDLLVFEER